MTRERVLKAIQLRDLGKTLDYIGRKVYAHPSTVSKWMRNYEIYGDSLFTGYPTVVVESSDD